MAKSAIEKAKERALAAKNADSKPATLALSDSQPIIKYILVSGKIFT
jgi:hypothetical protein